MLSYLRLKRCGIVLVLACSAHSAELISKLQVGPNIISFKFSSRDGRKWLVVSSQFNIHSEYRFDLNVLERQNEELLVLDRCDSEMEGNRFNFTKRCHGSHEYDYPQVLQVRFCLY